MMSTRFLPMSCTSPLTVPMTKVPTGSMPVSIISGRNTSSAPAMALPAMSISGTKKSPRSNRAPNPSSDGRSGAESRVSGRPALSHPLLRRDQRVVEQDLGAQAHLQAGVGQAEHLGRVADQGEVIKLAEQFL